MCVSILKYNTLVAWCINLDITHWSSEVATVLLLFLLLLSYSKVQWDSKNTKEDKSRHNTPTQTPTTALYVTSVAFVERGKCPSFRSDHVNVRTIFQLLKEDSCKHLTPVNITQLSPLFRWWETRLRQPCYASYEEEYSGMSAPEPAWIPLVVM